MHNQPVPAENFVDDSSYLYRYQVDFIINYFYYSEFPDFECSGAA